jgi:hypothetical protein
MLMIVGKSGGIIFYDNKPLLALAGDVFITVIIEPMNVFLCVLEDLFLQNAGLLWLK